MSQRPRRLQPWPVRLTHWLNVPLLAIMAGSGLQILVAYPELGPRGETYGWYPFSGVVPPPWLRIGDWLAGSRHFHFAFAWLFLLNGLVYVAWLLSTGEIRRRAFYPPRDLRSAIRTAAAYARLRGGPPAEGLYNGLQLLAYSSATLFGVLVIVSGVAIYKPVQLAWLAAIFGGYDGARAVHLLALGALGLFTVGHVVMVLLHPRTLIPMITGGPREPLAAPAKTSGGELAHPA